MSLENDITEIMEAIVVNQPLLDDLMSLATSNDHEELWIYLAKDNKLVYQGRWEASIGSKWVKTDKQSLYGTTTHGVGHSITLEEILSAVKSSDADEVLLVHNHPGDDLVCLMPPSGGDITTARKIGELADSVGINARFFIVNSPLNKSGVRTITMLEFDRNGKIIWTNAPSWLSHSWKEDSNEPRE